MGAYVNAMEIALLALAVLVLAIKEPRCEPPVEANQVTPEVPLAERAGRRPPRELRKF